ncbi:MAG: MlaD family protein [Solirubrobacterales bacterium]
MAILAVGTTAGALVLFGTAAGGEEGTYEVRAIFDNGGFLVTGEEVRVAGAKVGSISEVGVTNADEAATADGSPSPGKAVVVLSIDDPAFHDFRQDASCFIRPQSLLGEKFVECQPTEPRAAGTEAPPELEEVPDGEPGAGQRLLPLENNGKAVDIDLVNNIMREPYPDRFRLILNDLGAGLAARGDDLEAVIERSNPALQQTDEVLAILAKQNKELKTLARDGDQALQPLAAKRDSIGRFINAAATTAAATAERRADLEAQFQKLPGFLRELRLTMEELDDFNESSTPVLADLSDASEDLTRINVALGPFADAGTISLKSLGTAADAAGPDLVASQPVLKDIEALAKNAGPVATTLAKLLKSLRERGAYKSLTHVLYNLGGAINGYDSYGHFLRAVLPINNCVDYETVSHEAGCTSSFEAQPNKARVAPKGQRELALAKRSQKLGDEAGTGSGEAGSSSGAGIQLPFLDVEIPLPGEPEPDPEPEPTDPAPDPAPQPESAADSAAASKRSTQLLLDYLFGPQTSASGGKR